MKYFSLLMLIFTLFSACNKSDKKVEEHPKDFIGKWVLNKKVYSNGIEEAYVEGKDTYFLNEGGKLKREYLDHREETRDQQGEWKLFLKPSKDGKNDTTYLLKRTPLFNGQFEEQFRVINKSEKEMVLEENGWGFENTNSRDKLHFSKQ
jgi:hypothetical protein